ncbi:MAG: caspase family protein [Alphaproteobacteria bacterium TMED89]|nr:hypothetical protein [Rhodospirillaceae bacterium]RPH15468.1 MAG: caspase family protein [Alphaproteobacteria bacterium TMED89]
MMSKLLIRFVVSFLAAAGCLSFSAAHAQSKQHLAVLIGNQYYPDLNHDVDVSPHNVNAFERYLIRAENLRSDSIVKLANLDKIPLGRVFRPETGEIAKLLLANPEATRLTVYYSGHGTQDPSLMSEDQGILLGTDAEVGFEADYGVRTAVIVDNLASLATDTGVEITLILEACFNGQTGAGEPLNDETSGSLSDELGRKPAAGVTVVSASSKTQPAYWQSPEDYLNPLSRFTDAFLDALYGYGGGLDDGRLTMFEALEMANGIMRQSDSEQVATVAGFDADSFVLREGDFIGREATRRLCNSEVADLQSVVDLCSVGEIQSTLNARQCRYPDETVGYSSALQSAEQHLISLVDNKDTASFLDQRWQRSNQSARDARSYIGQCKTTVVSDCSQMCKGADALVREQKDDQSRWVLISGKKTRSAIKSYLSECERRVFCKGKEEALAFLDNYEREEALAEDLYAEYDNDPDVFSRLDGLEILVATLPDTETAAIARKDIETIRGDISEDQSAWRKINRDSESSLKSYVSGCRRRLICENEAEANDLLSNVRIMNELADAAFTEAKAIPDLARKKSALGSLIASYPNSKIVTRARSYLKDLNKNAKICVVRFTDRGSVSRRDYRTSSFSDLHVGKAANSSASYHVVLNTGTRELTVPVSYNVNGRTENKSGSMPGGQMLAAFVQTRVRSLNIAPQFLADMETCADFFRSKGATPPNIRTDFIQVTRVTPKKDEQPTQTAALNLDPPSSTTTAAASRPSAAEFIVTDSKKGLEIGVGPISILQNTVGSASRFTGKLVADVLLVDAYENGVQLFDTPRSVQIVVEDGMVTLIPNNIDYNLPSKLANMRLHMSDRTTTALVFRRLRNEPKVAQELASLCKAMSSRGLGEQLMSRFGISAVAGNNIWNVAQKCVWVAPQ